MLSWIKHKLVFIFSVIISMTIFLSYQNCSKVKFSEGKIEAASKAAAADVKFPCSLGQTLACTTGAQTGSMSCEATDSGPNWGGCVITTTTTTTLPGATSTTTMPTTTTTTVRANNPCLLILDDVGTPIPLAHGAAYTAYAQPNVPASGTCVSESRLCMNGSVTGSYRFSTCVRDSGQCSLNGVTVNHGSSAVFWEANVVPYGQVCQSQVRNCRDRLLDGSYQFPGPCTVASAANCAFGSDTILHGNFVDVYSSATVPYGQTCQPQRRTCTNGSLSGPASLITQCQPLPGADCSVGSVVVPHGTTRQFARTATVPYGNSCDFTMRTCTNGSLSGADFREISCRPDNAVDCNFEGQILAHGATVTAFSRQTVAYDAACTSVQGSVTCNNGTVQGAANFPFRTCQPATPRSCNYFGQTVAHHSSAISFSASSVPFLSSCDTVKKTSTCVDGSFQAPLAEFQNCSPLPETQCSFNGSLFSHGGVVRAAKYLKVYEPGVCEFENRTCDGRTGEFSGTFAYPHCDVIAQPPPSTTTTTVTTTTTTVPSGDCEVGHPMVWSQNGNQCAEFFNPPGKAFTYDRLANGQQAQVRSGYCASGTCYGDLVYKCVNGAVKYVTPTCKAGLEP